MGPGAAPSISVCICTHQGTATIEDTLWSLAGQSAEPALYEVLVVDNASADLPRLREILAGFASAAVPPRLVQEPKLGLSHARNRAVAESRGEYVFFLDDDAIASPRLVERYADALGAERPDVFGGNVLPLFEVQPPPELDYAWWPRWSLKHFGDADRWLGDGEYFIGTNLGAARKLLVERPFDPDLGRRGGALVGGEEWFLGEARYRRRFVAGAWVFHRVARRRMELGYLARRAHGGAITLGRGPAPPSRLLARARWLRFLLRELGLVARKTRFARRLGAEVRRLRAAP